MTGAERLKSVAATTDGETGAPRVAGATVMRRVVVFACVLSLITTGCATQRTEFVPPGEDRAELAAAIARQGQPTSPASGPSGYAVPPPQTRLDRVVQMTFEVTPCVLGVAAFIPLIALLILVPGPKPSLGGLFNHDPKPDPSIYDNHP
jgi:hypothetical protein